VCGVWAGGVWVWQVCRVAGVREGGGGEGNRVAHVLQAGM